MAKKSISLYCFSCDLDYTIKYDEENTKITPEYCSFCGEEVDEMGGEDENELDEEQDDSRDDWN